MTIENWEMKNVQRNILSKKMNEEICHKQKIY